MNYNGDYNYFGMHMGVWFFIIVIVIMGLFYYSRRRK